MNKISIVIILIIAVIIAVVVLSGESSEMVVQNDDVSGAGMVETPEAKLFDKAPDFSLKDYNGNTVSLADFSGKPLVLNAWAVWCPFCLDELPDFATVQKEFGDQVVIIAIDRAESLDTAKKFTDKLGVTDDIIFLLDPKDSFYRSIGGFAMPETLFVDGEGNIREHKRGPMEADEIREKVQRLLGG